MRGIEVSSRLIKRNKLVFGVGVNNADYSVTKHTKTNGQSRVTWTCPFYVSWVSVLRRCYSQIELDKHPTYIGCVIVPEWVYFMNFKAWMETQDWEGKELDKDLLVPGNKLYGPNTCVFVSQSVNKFVTERQNHRGHWPIGVAFIKESGKFLSYCNSVVDGKRKRLGLYETPEEAHAAWLDFKLEQAKILASIQEDERVSRALISRYENYIT
jgi:hypothetical protein